MTPLPPRLLATAMRSLLAVLLALVAFDAVRADAPPEPSALRRPPCSLNGKWCVTLSPAGPGRPAVARIDARAAEARAASGWTTAAPLLGWPAVTNDGACLVDFALESNLLPLDKGPQDTAFVFHCRNHPVSRLSLDQLIADVDPLPRSTSHRIWARSFGLDARDRLVVHTAEGRDFLIDPRSGKAIEGAYLR